uniref:Uncharacterized protein n=1 Tax=Arundo donax TaxID=35708 RepID=A0A0A9FU14_ARUDO
MHCGHTDFEMLKTSNSENTRRYVHLK